MTFSRRRWLGTAAGAAAAAAASRLAAVAGPAPEVVREFRAAWIATVFNLDWPSRPGLPAAQQRAQLVSQLDEASRLRLNAIILQVRPSGDALYNSRLEPWSEFLTGATGGSPGYDPLAFAVTEAHRRGLELHAWFNPFRAVARASFGPRGSHLAARHPEWTRSFAGQRWFDPGEPGVREHTIAVIADVARRYAVDGIHIDDYFYPYPPAGTFGLGTSAFPDGETFARYGRGQDRAAWRRKNIDDFVSGMYRAVKSVRPSAKVGISPFGIWRPGVPAGIEAKLDSYQYLGADARGWLARGWCDYLAPQLYWSIDPPEQSFSALLRWWHQQNRSGRHLWPGLAVDRIGSNRPASEITRQIALTRELAASGRAGHCHWPLRSLRQNRGGIQQALLAGPYATRAIVPATPWLGAAAPAVPRVICQNGRLGIASMPEAHWFAVHSWDGSTWSFASLVPNAVTENSIDLQVPDQARLAAVRAVSSAGVEGEATMVGIA